MTFVHNEFEWDGEEYLDTSLIGIILDGEYRRPMQIAIQGNNWHLNHCKLEQLTHPLAFNGVLVLYGTQIGTPLYFADNISRNIDGFATPIGLLNPGPYFFKNNSFENIRVDSIIRVQYCPYLELTDNSVSKSNSDRKRTTRVVRILQTPILQSTVVINGLSIVDNVFKNYMQIMNTAMDLKHLVIANLLIQGNSKLRF